MTLGFMRKYFTNEKGFIEDIEIDDFSLATKVKEKQDLCIAKEYFENEPLRSYLFEEIFGEIHDRKHNIGDHSLADKYMPDISAYTVDDVMHCLHFEELPKDWQRYTVKCIEKHFENNPKK